MSPFRSSFRALALALIFALVPTVTCAQITNMTNDQSTPIPGTGHDYIKMLDETLNPANGSVSLMTLDSTRRNRSKACHTTLALREGMNMKRILATKVLLLGAAILPLNYRAPNPPDLSQTSFAQ